MSFGRHLHLELCHLARELNVIFGMQIIFEMASYFVYLTVLCYYFCMRLMWKHSSLEEEMYSEIYYYFYMGLWIFLFSFKFYNINYICESIMVKVKSCNSHTHTYTHVYSILTNIIFQAKKKDKIIHQLTNMRQYVNISEEVKSILTQK